MTAAILVSGKLFRDPERKTARSGNTYGLATVRVGAGDTAQWFKVLAFGDEAREELLSLRAGDAVSAAGSLQAEAYTHTGGEARVSLSVMADRVISAGQVKRKKPATTAADRKPDRRAKPHARSPLPPHDGIEISF